MSINIYNNAVHFQPPTQQNYDINSKNTKFMFDNKYDLTLLRCIFLNALLSLLNHIHTHIHYVLATCFANS